MKISRCIFCGFENRSADKSFDDYLIHLIIIYQTWYNCIRPHENLDGRTPAEVCTDKKPNKGNVRLVITWNGVLSGYYFTD